MIDQPGFVSPPEDFRAQCNRHKQPTLRALLWHFHPLTGLLHSPLDVPGEGSYHHSLRKDGLSQRFLPGSLEQTREGIWFNILETRQVREGKVKMAKEEYLLSLA